MTKDTIIKTHNKFIYYNFWLLSILIAYTFFNFNHINNAMMLDPNGLPAMKNGIIAINETYLIENHMNIHFLLSGILGLIYMTAGTFSIFTENKMLKDLKIINNKIGLNIMVIIFLSILTPIFYAYILYAHLKIKKYIKDIEETTFIKNIDMVEINK